MVSFFLCSVVLWLVISLWRFHLVKLFWLVKIDLGLSYFLNSLVLLLVSNMTLSYDNMWHFYVFYILALSLVSGSWLKHFELVSIKIMANVGLNHINKKDINLLNGLHFCWNLFHYSCFAVTNNHHITATQTHYIYYTNKTSKTVMYSPVLCGYMF